MYQETTCNGWRRFLACLALAASMTGCAGGDAGSSAVPGTAAQASGTAAAATGAASRSTASTTTASTGTVSGTIAAQALVVAGSPPTTVQVGAKYQYVPSVAGAGKNALSYDITNKPAWATFTATTGEVSGSPSAADVGTTPGVEIGVSDGTSRATVGPFNIRVTPASSNPPPGGALTIAGTPPATVVAGQAYSFTPTVTNSSGAALTFSIGNRPVWAAFNTATGQLSGTPAAANEGTFANIILSVKSATANVSLPVFAIQVETGVPPAPTLESIALSPLTARLAPLGTQQLAVTALYSDGSTKPVAATGATYKSSNPAVASVSPTGLVSVAAGAAVGAVATISASDNSADATTSTAASTVITVTTAGIGPTPTSVAAANATVQSNPLCGTPITPFYWEIGDQNGALISGSVGADTTGAPVLVTTKLSIASASKWIYSTYVTQLRGSASKLTAQDVNFLHFTSGYDNMDNQGTACPASNNPNTVNQCLTRTNPQGASFSAQNTATIGSFYYNGGHMENHASQLTPLGPVAVGSLASSMLPLLGSGINLVYTEPLMSGGILTTAQDYATVLRRVLDGSLAMHDALGTSPVCTLPSASCNASFTPIQEAWHYSIGHWVEDDPTVHGDGAFSSPGAFGFYPWIDATKTYYGVIARAQQTGTGEQQGYASAQCGRLIRHAWMTGVEQTQTIPTG